jgi:hypothetical protein
VQGECLSLTEAGADQDLSMSPTLPMTRLEDSAIA